MSQPAGCHPVVVKLGGSILTDPPAYRSIAEWLHRRAKRSPNERIVAVVSAQFGQTDELVQLAHEASPEPEAGALDLLLATGEIRSAALLALHLGALGASVRALNVHETGLESNDGAGTLDGLRVNPLHISLYLRRHAIVVVPGFFACAPGGGMVSLGRGGSDLSAVLLASALRADRCELIKDVPGYFTRDPQRCADAEPLPHITVQEGLELAAAGCDLVQRQALVAAGQHDMPLLIRALDDTATRTWVTPQRDATASTGALSA